jgi:uncharacterized protein with FMN-binding domain
MDTDVGFARRVAPAVLVAVAGGALLYALPSPAGSEATDEVPAPASAPTATSTAAPGSTATPGPTDPAAAAARIVHGDAIGFRFGTVQADVELTGSTITDITTVQAPGGGYQKYTDRAIPTMRQRIIKAQSTNVAAVSGATYTSKGYAESVQSALNKG